MAGHRPADNADMQSLAPPTALVPLSARVRVDLTHQRVWLDGVAISLRPKAWQALAYLLRRPGELVTMDEMLDALWPRQEISAKTMANLVSELRAALGDDQAPAQLLQTVHRRGYRLQPFGSGAPPAAKPGTRTGTATGTATSTSTGTTTDSAASPCPPPRRQPGLVGRQAELARLELTLRRSAEGQRQLALVAGDPGLGKTALLDHFIRQVAGTAAVACRGACLEQRSEREPFAPVLALLADLCSGPLAGQASAALRRCAPTWLAQMPWLVQPHELPELRKSLAGMGIGRMLREFGALLQALCTHTPLVLVLEDLHWADAATIDLLQQLATDRSPARLMLVASYQPALAAINQHPVTALAQRLPAQGQASLLALKALSPDELGLFIATRFDDPALAAPLLAWAQQQTMGIPLYLEAALNHLQDSGALAWQQGRWQLLAPPSVDALAEPLRPLITAGFDRLDSATRQLLEAASVVGMQVPVQLLAAALQQDPALVEQACNALARQDHYLRAQPPAQWPDGSSAGVYALVHDIYRRALYDGIAPALRQALHRRVAERLEAGWAGQVPQVAGQLASAYARAAMPDATARVLEMTAHLSAQRFAYAATIDALQACLQQLAQTPDTPERTATDIRVNLMLGNVALNHQGVGGALVLPAFERAQNLARQTGATRELIRAQLGATVSLVGSFHPQPARQLAQDTLALAQAWQPTLAAVAHHYAGMAVAIAGDLQAASHHQQAALGLQPDPLVPMFFEVHSSAQLHLGRLQCFCGQAEQGLPQVDAGLARARELSTPADLTHKLYWAGDTHRLLGLTERAHALLTEALDRADTHDQPGPLAASRMGLAALPAPAQRDIAQLQALAAAYCRPGDHHAALMTSLILTETHLAQGRPEAALAAWSAGRAVTPPGALFDPELYRLHGCLMASGLGSARQAEASWQAGLAIARQQGALLFAQRCASNLAAG